MLKKILFILLCTVYNSTYSCDDFEDAFNQLLDNTDTANSHTVIINNTNTQYTIASIKEEHLPQSYFTPVEDEKFITITIINKNIFLNEKRKRSEDK